MVDGDGMGGRLMRGMNHDVTLGRERERASERRVQDILLRGECELLNPDLQRTHFESVGACWL